MKKILITGANGLLGQKLTELILSENNFLVIATGKGDDRNPQTHPNYRYVSMDITDAAVTNKTFLDLQPHYIIHSAAMTNVDACEQQPEECQKQNVDAVRNIIKAAEQINAFLIHLSTDFIFDGTKAHLTEEDQANPISIYGQSKWDAEKLVHTSKLRWAIVRTAIVFGIVKDMSRSNIILWVKKSLEEKKNIKVVNDQFRTPTLAEDLAMGCMLIVKKEAEGIFNITGEDFLTPYEMAIETATFFKLDAPLIEKTDSKTFVQPARRPPITGLVIDKAKKILGFQPHSFKESLSILEQQLNKE